MYIIEKKSGYRPNTWRYHGKIANRDKAELWKKVLKEKEDVYDVRIRYEK